jgi:D-glycero-alpha-D-manno-heptose-7-phosphate kinase
MRTDEKIFIHSMDLGEELRADNLSDVLKSKGQFDLIKALLKAIRPDFGFELYLHSDFPMKSGLGGSSVVSASILGCFNQFRRDQWDSYEIAEIAYQAERHHMNVAGGWQDQYAAVFGGFNFMEFRLDQNIVHPLRIHTDTLLELEESLILCDTGTTHESGDIHADQRKQMAVANTSSMVQANVDLSYEMRNHLLRGRLLHFAQAMDQAWQNKRQLSNKISSPQLDQIYAEAKANGATAGKLLGAGGGGFFLFYVPAYQKHRLISHLQDSGLGFRPFRFESKGLEAWTVRENTNL